MSMRKQFVTTVEKKLRLDERVVLLLGDIGVFGFSKAFTDFANRVYNIGILEPATVSLASGLAKSDLIPVVHTIAPFLVERSFEQIKIDFGYQRLGGNFVSVGASYDYASLGCTHHCPGDVALLQNIPGVEIIVPGTASEFDSLFSQAYDDGFPTYYRLSEHENANSQRVIIGQANVVKAGSLATVVAFGPTLSCVMSAVEGLDAGVLYYTTVSPFDEKTLRENVAKTGKVMLVEPFYSGTTAYQVIKALERVPARIEFIGVPKEFLTNYGKATEHDHAIGLTAKNIREKLEALIHD